MPSPSLSSTPPREISALEARVARLDVAIESLTRATMVCVVLAAALVAVFWTSPLRLAVYVLLAATTLAGGGAYGVLRAAPWRCASPVWVPRAETILVLAAGLLGLVWAAMPIVLFPTADIDRQMVVLAVLAIAIGNVYGLGPLQPACVAYLAPIVLGGFVGLASIGSPTTIALALALPLLAALVLAHVRRLNDDVAQRIVDQIRLCQQHATIHDLLLDFDENQSDWLWRTDAKNLVVSAADDIASAFEASGGASFGSTLSKRRDHRLSNGGRAVLAAMAARKPFRNQLVEVLGEEASLWWRLSGKPMFDDDGAFRGYHGVGSDMTGARNSESRIAYLAEFDALTGFANRANFQAFAARQCAAAAADGHIRALLCLDLDGFKSVNDSLGHDGGDELLKQVAARLTALAPADGFLARLGGDEFALWLPATTPAKAEALAQNLVEALAAPFRVHDVEVEIGVSVGIALTPKHATDPDDLLVKADLALYRAKGDGKGQARMFEQSLETSQIERRKLEHDLKLALARGEFELYYQPLVDLAEGRVVCFEALIRWRSPERGFVSPADFIPVAEATGLIVPIGRWALFTACREAKSWPDDIRVAVNVSPPQVRAADFLQDVTMALKMSGLAPTRLEIEVTEGIFLDKAPMALATLRTLRDRGIVVALDDFGTGYSSLNYLIDFPVAKIKIDRSFITDLPGSETVQAVVDAMLALAKRLAIRVVAEGVETREQALALKRRRCDMIQGYLFSRPRPAADIAEMIAAVPKIFQDALPTHIDSPLALALAAKKQAAG